MLIIANVINLIMVRNISYIAKYEKYCLKISSDFKFALYKSERKIFGNKLFPKTINN